MKKFNFKKIVLRDLKRFLEKYVTILEKIGKTQYSFADIKFGETKWTKKSRSDFWTKFQL